MVISIEWNACISNYCPKAYKARYIRNFTDSTTGKVAMVKMSHQICWKKHVKILHEQVKKECLKL